jgi:peptidoglycan/LPS O-acetylase OafA/YrhL
MLGDLQGLYRNVAKNGTVRMNKPTKKTSTRIVELDCLRALAAINLLLFHFTYVYQVKYGFIDPIGFMWPYGKYGVQLFFMLSGFVNAMTLLKKRDPKKFLVGRIVRVCPSYWTAIAMNLVLLTMLPLTSIDLGGADLLANLTIMPNLFGYQCIEPVTWTLQIELLFYALMIGLFMSGALKRPLLTFSMLVSVSAIVCTISQQGWTEGTGLTAVISALRTVFILDYIPLFAVGVLLNQIKNNSGNRWANIAGILFSTIIFHAIDQRDHNPAVTVFFTALLAMSAYGKIPVLRFKPLVFVSTISYSLYLLHNNFGCVLMYHANQMGMPTIGCLLLATGASVLLAYAVTRWFERPFSRWLQAKASAPLPAKVPSETRDRSIAVAS